MKLASPLLSFLAAAALGSCTAASDVPSTAIATSAINLPLTCGCSAMTPRLWTTSVTDYWDSTATSMTVVFTATGDGTTDSFYAWGIGDGQHVGWLYKVPMSAYLDFEAHVDRAFIAAQSVASERTWSIAGGLGTGGPGPIGPGGIPSAYVARILRTAGTIVDTTNAALGVPPR